MAINRVNFTSNLEETLFNKIKTVIGSTYTHPSLGSRPITFSGAYPPDMEAYIGSLPLVIFTRGTKGRPTQFEQGGARKYTDFFYVDIIAGGFVGQDTANVYMKNALTDLLLFGLDNKRFNFINYGLGTTEGQFQVDAYEVARIPSNRNSVFERNHSQVMLGTWVTIKT